MLDELVPRYRQHDRQALARLLTLVARGEHVESIRSAVPASPAARGAGDSARACQPARVVAVTGGAGVGKSTLIGKVIEFLRANGWSVAVLACDPQSPLTGGALLGDRVRMPNRPDDPGVFIRSLATAPGHEAIAENLDLMVRLLESFGFDWILIETVGAGQSETAVRAVADVVVLLLQPETGDDLQWEKSGLLEVADVVVIHKADLPAADLMDAQVRGLLNLPGCRDVPVLRASAARGVGIDAIVQLVNQLPSRRLMATANGDALLRLAQQTLADAVHRQTDRLRPLLERWQRKEIDDQQAVSELFHLVSLRPRSTGLGHTQQPRQRAD